MGQDFSVNPDSPEAQLGMERNFAKRNRKVDIDITEKRALKKIEA